MSKPQPRVVGIIQARMGSSRLPGKVLLDISGRPMLMRVVDRASAAENLDDLVVATTSDPDDDSIISVCREHSIPAFRGHPTDVLDRFYQAANAYAAEVVVRLTADCPLLDPGLIDHVVTTFLNSDPPPDFVTNRLPDDRTFPIGLDVEVCGIEALKQAWESATELYQREHVMPYLYEIPGRFDIEVIRNPVDHSHLRWTVDEQEDLELVRELYRELDQRQSFNWRDIVELIESQPALAELNATVAHKGLGE